ncbi:hypothetical protein HC028_23475 [Planosporangium flavigriseum]|uniref:MoxR-vWA-beta-propeller ternary system domain-containing protein n=1 Tax=Planosporangium flavigriseum TaxID=373681 RepID=A0A8J3LQS2_9ACTN|nr:bpX6 domain-containing protein [Planosporangium flavigriseum]NJC67436.1 hypothetical protein [Planosporangium flavigriseum]GIG74923.1 hypothetical protein Pfl04_33270 [Planosporangium flavigriseum]
MSAFRGRLQARALVIDVPLLGEPEARQRVIEAWQPAAALFELPNGAWLLEYDRAVEVRAELSPGLVLVDSDGVLHADGTPTADARPGDVLIPHAATTTRFSRTELTPVDRDSWFDLSNLRIEPVAALDRPATAAVTPPPWQPPPPAPDLRTLAGIAQPSPRTRRLLTTATRSNRRSRPPGAGPGRAALLTAALVAVVCIIGALVAASNSHLIVPVVVGLGVALLRGARTGTDQGAAYRWAGGEVAAAGRPGSAGGRWGALLARLVLASPAAGLAARAQQRYLRRLNAAFSRRDWDTALREAIAVGGKGGALTLRLPRPRTGDLVPHPHLGTGSGIPLDPGAQNRLRTLYRQAATELERAGRIEESAFVLADLLDESAEAVGLLERNDQARLAATLAEGRELDPNLVVRLWWRAGDRDRAVQVARARGAFAGAIERLAQVDTAAARQLRAKWVHALQAAGDHGGAVDAAWPDEELRPLVVANIQAGMALGGHTAGYLFAHLATWQPTSDTMTTAVALLDGRDQELASAQRGFVSALAELRCADAAQDRRLCTAALRLLVRDPAANAVSEPSGHKRITRALRDRADRLAAADLPPVPTGRGSVLGSRVDITTTGDPGQLPLHDAVTLSGRMIITAHGDFGVRLIGLDGRTRASWDAPAHQLVVADHGANVLLVARRGRTCELRRLDLTTRRLGPPVVVTAHHILPDYDGALLTVLDDDGIAFIDLVDTTPRIAWRELDSTIELLHIDRSPTSLAALVRVTDPLSLGEASTQVWRWDLPSLMLRSRQPVNLDGTANVAVLASATLLTTKHDESTDTYDVTGHRLGPWITSTKPTLLASGGVFGLRIDEPDRTTVEIPDSNLRVVFPATVAGIGVRKLADTLAVWDQTGRLVAIDLSRRQPIARLRTRL